MNINLISLSRVKTELGIEDSSQDAALTARIPIVSADVRRILNCKFDDYLTALYVSGTAEVNITPPNGYDELIAGLVIVGDGIPDDTYLTDFDPITGIWSISNAPTTGGVWINPTINISQWSTISKMIWYKTQKLITTDVDVKGVKSERYGPVSVTYTDTEIDKEYDYPIHLLNDLGMSYAEVS